MTAEHTVDGRPRLLDETRHRLRVVHYSYRTEEHYVQWIRELSFSDPPYPPGAPLVFT